MAVVINPGTGPVVDSTLANAEANLNAFITELALEAATEQIEIIRKPNGDYEGRFSFELKLGTRFVEIDMPGLPLDSVRYSDGMNPWLFPRPYVDGSSWLWKFAIEIAHEQLIGEGAYEEDEG